MRLKKRHLQDNGIFESVDRMNSYDGCLCLAISSVNEESMIMSNFFSSLTLH